MKNLTVEKIAIIEEVSVWENYQTVVVGPQSCVSLALTSPVSYDLVSYTKGDSSVKSIKRFYHPNCGGHGNGGAESEDDYEWISKPTLFQEFWKLKIKVSHKELNKTLIHSNKNLKL